MLTVRRSELNDGSSPLARGLHSTIGEICREAGIIPARAGFTEPEGRDNEPDEDHPRSRGVYLLVRVSDALATGSSPLARGLR